MVERVPAATNNAIQDQDLYQVIGAAMKASTCRIWLFVLEGVVRVGYRVMREGGGVGSCGFFFSGFYVLCSV